MRRPATARATSSSARSCRASSRAVVERGRAREHRVRPPFTRRTGMPKPTKHDPLEAAKITTERAQADEAALGVTMPVDPTRPPLVGEAPPGQFVPPPESGEPATPLLEGGPTIEEWIASGYPAEKYPPSGYAEKPSS